MAGDEERCIVCDEPTGRAGKGEDSMYCDRCGNGPFCEGDFDAEFGLCVDCANRYYD